MSKKLAIIGGGPVGLFLSLALAKRGLSSTVFEKGSWPLDKVCGQGIMPSGVELLKNMGLCFNEEESFSFDGIQYIHEDIQISGQLPEKGMGIERNVLSQKLYDKAKGNKLISLHPNTNVSEVAYNQNGVSFKANGKEKHFDFLFACDGLNSTIRKQLKFEKLRKGTLRLGARAHFNMVPWNEKIEVYWNNGVEAYVTPVSKEKIEVAFLWFEETVEKGAFLFERLLSLFPELEKKLLKEKMTNDFRAYGPFKYTSKKCKIGPIFFVGDAYKFLDGITGEGLSLGFKSASILAHSFEKYDLKTRIKLYLIYFNYSLWVGLALSLSRNFKWRKLVFTLASKVNKLFDFILSINDSKLGRKYL